MRLEPPPPLGPRSTPAEIVAARRLPASLSPAFAWLARLPFYQAGLQGYSDAPMRIIARRHGSPYCMTESLLDTTLTAGGKGLAAARLVEEDHPIAGQLMGSHPRDIAAGARVLVELGYDVVDVNLACPVKRVRKHARGGHLLAEPEEACAILAAVADATGGAVPLTVKLRRGTDESPAARDRLRRILERAIELGYFSATVHARTVEQKYRGPSRWSELAALVERYPDFPLFGSGDIFDARAIFEMIRQTGVRAVSVARGAIANPWIFRAAHALLEGRAEVPPSPAEERRWLEEQFELMRRFEDEPSTLRRMRKQAIELTRHHSNAEHARDAFIAVRDRRGWQDALERLAPAPSADAMARPAFLASTTSPAHHAS